VRNLSYTFANGLAVGDPEDKIKQAFGKDFLVDNEALIYRDKRLTREIDSKNKTVRGIRVFGIAPSHNLLFGPLVLPKIKTIGAKVKQHFPS
jgi:hypothetical protein